MRVLLDECIDEEFRHYFTGHHCQTCRFAGFRGLTNGRLLTAAEEAGFEVLITVDQNIPYQQSLRSRSISVVVLRARSSNFDDLEVLVPDLLKAIQTLRLGEMAWVGVG